MFARTFFRGLGLGAVLADLPHERGLSHRTRAFAAAPPRRHRRYVERGWQPA